MKKSILFIAMLSMMATSFAQQGNNFFNIHNEWSKVIGYSYQPGYPYGVSLSGGSFMSIGFAAENTRYDISTIEYREPTWSMRFGWIGYSFDKDVTGWGAITFRPYVAMGMDFAKRYTLDNGTYVSKRRTYFTFAPTLLVNVYMLHFSVGYEFVPKFSALNGINFGVGFSIPASKNHVADKVKGNIKQ